MRKPPAKRGGKPPEGGTQNFPKYPFIYAYLLTRFNRRLPYLGKELLPMSDLILDERRFTLVRFNFHLIRFCFRCFRNHYR
jgi:hypothetical protein